MKNRPVDPSFYFYKGPRLLAWGIQHDAHGIVVDTLIFLPENEVPETYRNWVRLYWLDQPAR